MKNKLILIGIIAVTALFGLSILACKEADKPAFVPNPVDGYVVLYGNAVFTLNGVVPDFVNLYVFGWEGEDREDIYSESIEPGEYSVHLDDKWLNKEVQLVASLSDGENYSMLEICKLTLNAAVQKYNIQMHAAAKVKMGGTADIKLNGAYPASDTLFLEVIDEYDYQYFYGQINPNGTWEVEFWAPNQSVEVYILLYTELTGWYKTDTTITLSASVFSSPTAFINKPVNLSVNIPPRTKSEFLTVFDTNSNLSLNLRDGNHVNKGTTLFAEILNGYVYYTHSPVHEYTWFINGNLQSVTTAKGSNQYHYFGNTNLPTSTLTPGKQYGLVVVTIDGVAFAQEFEFFVN
ncbi:MAG: hypothetical protein FWB73_02995 [Treponema sp.]|nr:hypothetical protein [Treponema sp.]